MVKLQPSPVTRRTQLHIQRFGGNNDHQVTFLATPVTASAITAAEEILGVFSNSAINMTTKAVLLCRPNSHPFTERTLYLDQPVKVGRSVARARPGPNNGVFDCKVLSRNHALLWYENGKFYLQDTKSSNGTFVNNQRLSKGTEDSLPREVCSGDIVQFGVDVMENSRKVTHGCIIATLKLYLADGKEAKASPSTAMIPPYSNTIATQDLYQLAQYLQEALQREQMLENKLNTLQKLVLTTEEATESSWKALIDEDRLLTRLEILENQVQSCSKNIGEDRLREEVLQLQEDKDQYQVAAKELLKKLLHERLEAVKKLQDSERSLANAEEECKALLKTYEDGQKELQFLAENYNCRLKDIQVLEEKLQQAEAKEKEKSEQDSEKKFMEIKSLQDEQDSVSRTIITDAIIKTTDDSDDSMSEAENSFVRSSAVQVDLIENGRLHMNEELKEKLRNSEKELSESQIKVADLNKSLDRAQVDAVKSINKVAQLEIQLQEAKTQLENSNFRIKQLQEQIESLEKKLRYLQSEESTPTKHDSRLTIVYESEVDGPTPTVTLPLPPRSMSPVQGIVATNGNTDSDEKDENDEDDHKTGVTNHKSQTEERTERINGEQDEVNDVVVTDSVNQSTCLTFEIDKLKELLSETRENKSQAEKDVARFKAELEDARNNVKKAANDSNVLRQQLQQAQVEGEELSLVVQRLQDQLKYAEACSRDVQQQVNALRERLGKEQQLVYAKQGDIDILRQQLMEVQHSYKQAHNEAEQLRNKLEALAESNTDALMKQQQAGDPSSSDLQTMQDECLTLKLTVLNLESKLRQVINEKSRLQEEFSKTEIRNETTTTNVTSTATPLSPKSEGIGKLHEEIKESEQKLLVAYSEIVNLKETCAAYNEEKSRLRHQLELAGQTDYQTKVLYLLPMVVAIVGFFAIFYPSLVFITATLDPSLPS